jgi:hypothetical protein
VELAFAMEVVSRIEVGMTLVSGLATVGDIDVAIDSSLKVVSVNVDPLKRPSVDVEVFEVINEEVVSISKVDATLVVKATIGNIKFREHKI